MYSQIRRSPVRLDAEQTSVAAVVLDPFQIGVELLTKLWCDQFLHRYAEKLGDFVPQKPRRRGIHRKQLPLKIMRTYQVFAVLHQVAIPIFTFAELGLMPTVRGRQAADQGANSAEQNKACHFTPRISAEDYQRRPEQKRYRCGRQDRSDDSWPPSSKQGHQENGGHEYDERWKRTDQNLQRITN